MKLKINKQNYFIYLVIFSIILLVLFAYLFLNKNAIVHQLYKELYGIYPSSNILREGLDITGLDWDIYSGYINEPLGDTSGMRPIASGSGAYDLSSLTAMTGGVRRDNGGDHYWTIVLKGYFMPNVSGNWSFRTSSDDGSYLWIGAPAASGWNRSNTLIDNGNLHANQMASSKYQVNLVAGQNYPIRIQMGENGGLYNLTVGWLAPGTGNWASNGAGMLTSSTASSGSQYAPQSGLLWRTYNGYYGNDRKNNQENVWFSSTYQLTNRGRAINTHGLNLITGGYIQENVCIQDNGSDNYPTGYVGCNGTNTHNFSLEMTGYFYTNTANTSPNQRWNFFLTSDDSSYMWIGDVANNGWNTSNATVNNGGLHGMNLVQGSAVLQPNTYYPIRIVFGENGGGFNMRFGWQPPGGSWTSNGAIYLYSEKYSEMTNDNVYYGALSSK